MKYKTLASTIYYITCWLNQKETEYRCGLAMRKLSVRLSVKRMDCDKTEEGSSVQIFIPHERSFSLVFWEEEWLMGRPLVSEILGQLTTIGAKSLILNQYSLVAPQRKTPSEKSSINTNRKSTMRFPMSLRWSSYVAPKPPKGRFKNTKWPISV